MYEAQIIKPYLLTTQNIHNFPKIHALSINVDQLLCDKLAEGIHHLPNLQKLKLERVSGSALTHLLFANRINFLQILHLTLTGTKYAEHEDDAITHCMVIKLLKNL